MTLIDIENAVLFQTNNDIDDLTDYIPHLPDYINEGYDRLVVAFANKHLNEDTTYVTLASPTDAPAIPEWAHVGIRDYATYLMYRNGNPSKQQRGMLYLQAFQEVERRLRYDTSKKWTTHIKNIYARKDVT